MSVRTSIPIRASARSCGRAVSPEIPKLAGARQGNINGVLGPPGAGGPTRSPCYSVQGEVPAGGPLAIVKTLDPSVTHPLRQKDAIEKIGSIHGHPMTSHLFQAIVWKHKQKENSQMCWKTTEGVLTRYSQDAVTWIKRLSQADVEAAITDYRAYLRAKSQAGKKGR